MKPSHLTDEGKAFMVDISAKNAGLRSASAEGYISLSRKAYECAKNNNLKKGDLLSVSKIAGIQGAKLTSNLIPLCHPIKITHCDIMFTMNDERNQIHVKAIVKTIDATGVEMEALTAAAVSLLTIYDMVKAIDKSAAIGCIRLLKKSGGKSGTYIAKEISHG